MGYRSDWNLMIRKEDEKTFDTNYYNNLIKEIENQKREISKDHTEKWLKAIKQNDNYHLSGRNETFVLYGEEFVKWYLSFPEVAALYKTLEILNENKIPFAYVCMGEELTDNEVLNGDGNYEANFPYGDVLREIYFE